MIEQRSEPRARTHLFGRIVFGSDRSVRDCLVHDLSSGGARLSLAFSHGSRTSSSCTCRRAGRSVGYL